MEIYKIYRMSEKTTDRLKWAAGWINTIILIGAFLTVGMFYQEIKQLLFDTVRQKIETVDHAKEAEAILKKLEEREQKAIENDQDAIQSRATRDTLLKKAIDLAERNAVTTYQNKQQTDSILKLWNQYNESQD